MLVNATVGESHDVKLESDSFWDALRRAVGLTDANKEIPLAWFLDTPAFERFDDAGQAESFGNTYIGNIAFNGPRAGESFSPFPRPMFSTRAEET